MVIVKPNFMTGIIQKQLANNTYSVKVLGKIINIKGANILQTKIPFYKENYELQFYC